MVMIFHYFYCIFNKIYVALVKHKRLSKTNKLYWPQTFEQYCIKEFKRVYFECMF